MSVSLQMLSLLPQRILRLLEFIGFSGNRVSFTFYYKWFLTEQMNFLLLTFVLLLLAGFWFVHVERRCLQSQSQIYPLFSDTPFLQHLRFTHTWWENKNKICFCFTIYFAHVSMSKGWNCKVIVKIKVK